jgi:hypothetical protein
LNQVQRTKFKFNGESSSTHLVFEPSSSSIGESSSTHLFLNQVQRINR